MIALKLKNTKNFMTHLLLSDTFDNFLFIEGEIVTFNTFTIDGYIQKAFYEDSMAPGPDSPGSAASSGSGAPSEHENAGGGSK